MSFYFVLVVCLFVFLFFFSFQSHGVDMTYCSSWYCSCNIVKYFVSSVVSILYCKFLIDDIIKKIFKL